MIQWMLAIWSLVPLPSKTSLNICKFTVHILLKPGSQNFEHYFTTLWNECNCAVVWAIFGIAFLWDWSSKLNSPIPVHFSLLIPKMLMFTLAISCLTNSNLPWFMDLTGEGNGTPLQYSCLENPTDGGAWPAAVHGSLRVGHDWATSLLLFTFMHWRRKWQPTPVFLPGESQGRGSLVGCRLWGRTQLDTTEAT